MKILFTKFVRMSTSFLCKRFRMIVCIYISLLGVIFLFSLRLMEYIMLKNIVINN